MFSVANNSPRRKGDSRMASSEFPRQFVRPTDALDDWPQIEPYFQLLLAAGIDSAEKLNQWLLDWSELAACLDEEGTGRYVRMTCQTDDAERKQAYLDFVENIEPRCKPLWHEIDKKFTAAALDALPAKRFEVFTRGTRNRVELFRDENVALEVQEAKLEQRYQEISGAMTVEYDGRERTLQQLSVYLERTDREVREDVWNLSTQRRLADADVLDDIFDELFRLRHQMARNAGLPDYRAYAFKRKERFDYTPDDCLAFHEAVERTCVPLLRQLHDRRRRNLAVDTLRPWDLIVDETGRPPLRPFDSPAELTDKCRAIFTAVHPDLGEQFLDMTRRGDLDLESRKGKAPGGYQSTFHESRRPFIFMNAVGMHRDVRTLIHEGGHAFHSLACRDEPLVQYRSAPIEFAEVASMGMEMLALDAYDVFYEGDDLARAKRMQLEGVVNVLPWIATIDAFQHWMYTNPEHTRDQRRQQWLALHERFGGPEDYTNHEQALARSWQKQLHLFEVPFYYIEYGIAQLGALQVWRNAMKSKGHAVDAYRRALALGGSRPLPELFAAADIAFDFSADTLAPLMDLVQTQLDALGDVPASNERFTITN